MSSNSVIDKSHKARQYVIHPLREAIAVGCIIYGVIFIVSYFIYTHALNAQKGEIREGLLRSAQVIATLIDGDKHKMFIDPAQELEQPYKDFIKPLETVLDTDKTIVFIYTTILKDNNVYFVIDPTPPGDADGDGVDDKSHIMQPYPEATKELVLALEERRPIPTDEPYQDQWGNFMSAYVPFYDSQGEFVGVLGVDISADNYFERLAPMLRATARALVVGFFVSFVVGALVWFMRNFAAVINEKRNQLLEDYVRLTTVQEQVEKPITTDAKKIGKTQPIT